LTVATDDLMERQTALTFGASTISTGMLLDLMGDAEGDLQRRLKKQRQG